VLFVLEMMNVIHRTVNQIVQQAQLAGVWFQHILVIAKVMQIVVQDRVVCKLVILVLCQVLMELLDRKFVFKEGLMVRLVHQIPNAVLVIVKMDIVAL